MFTFFYGIARIFGVPTFVQVGTDGIVVNRSTGAAILGIDPRTIAFETMRRAGRRIALNGNLNVRGGTIAASALKVRTWRYVGLESLLSGSAVCREAAARTDEYRMDPVAVLNAAYAFYGIEAEAKAA
mgnify:CR=1 FL=1